MFTDWLSHTKGYYSSVAMLTLPGNKFDLLCAVPIELTKGYYVMRFQTWHFITRKPEGEKFHMEYTGDELLYYNTGAEDQSPYMLRLRNLITMEYTVKGARISSRDIFNTPYINHSPTEGGNRALSKNFGVQTEIKKPAVSKKPAVGKKTAVKDMSSDESDRENGRSEDGPAVSKKPAVIKKPAVSKKPVVSKKPAVIKKSVVIKKPAVGKNTAAKDMSSDESDSENGRSEDGPALSKKPAVSKRPVVSNNPAFEDISSDESDLADTENRRSEDGRSEDGRSEDGRSEDERSEDGRADSVGSLRILESPQNAGTAETVNTGHTADTGDTVDKPNSISQIRPESELVVSNVATTNESVRTMVSLSRICRIKVMD